MKKKTLCDYMGTDLPTTYFYTLGPCLQSYIEQA